MYLCTGRDSREGKRYREDWVSSFFRIFLRITYFMTQSYCTGTNVKLLYGSDPDSIRSVDPDPESGTGS
jgi:hypothetical protein